MTSAFGRRFRLAGLAFVLGATLGSACGGSDANESATFDTWQVTKRALADDVLHTTRPVEQLAADGARVAILYSGGGVEPCIDVWDISTSRIYRFPSTAERCPSRDEDTSEITEVALAGRRLLWAQWQQHNRFLGMIGQVRLGPHGLFGVRAERPEEPHPQRAAGGRGGDARHGTTGYWHP